MNNLEARSETVPIVIGTERGEIVPSALRDICRWSMVDGRWKKKYFPWTMDYGLPTTMFLCLLAGCLFLSSCKGKKAITDNTKPGKKTNKIAEHLIENQLDIDWFSAKAKMVPEGLGVNTSFSTVIRIKKDSAIWVSASKLSFEVGRVLVRPDSVFVIDRLSKSYYARPLDYVEEEFNLPADFQLLQDMILGNAVIFDPKGVKVKELGDRHILVSEDADMRLEYTLGAAPDYLLEKMSADDTPNERSFSIDFDDYKLLDKKYQFAYDRDIQMSSQETGEAGVDIQFSKVEINAPKKMPFSVSSRYTAK